MSWTRFMDMHSGGGTKTDYEYIYIEANEDCAVEIFEKMFEESPYEVACDCCGPNFSISSGETLEGLTEYDRLYGKVSLEDYVKQDEVLIVYREDFK